MAQTTEQVKLAKQAEQAVQAKRAPTAQQAERAKQASRAIHIDELKYLRNQNKNVDTFLANYNDPTELNSYIDALTNREAVSKKFGDTWGTISTLSGTVSVLSFIGATIASLIPGGQAVAPALYATAVAAATPAIPAAVDVTVEKGIKPILAGKPQEAFLNTLMNLGETMDYASNPIKGFFLEGPEGFVKGTGLAQGGRVNYDYDTGFFLTDMLLETVSDPVNWIDFGVSTILKRTTKTVGREVTEQMTGQFVDTVNNYFGKTLGEISTEGTERITTQVSKTAAQVSREWAEKNVSKLTREEANKLIVAGRQRIQRTLVRAIRQELPKASSVEIDILLKRAGRSAHTGRFLRSAYNQIQDITMDTLSSDVIKALSSSQYYSKAAQKFMTKAAFMSSGYGAGIELIKRGAKPISEWANKTILRKVKAPGYFNEVAGINIKEWEQAKAYWNAGGMYTSAITGEAAVRDINTFYQCAQEQFIRDQDAIRAIIKTYPNDFIKQGLALDSLFNKLYGCDFQQYIEFLKTINASEGNKFKIFSDYAEQFANFIKQGSIALQAGSKLKTTKSLYRSGTVESLIENNTNTLIKLQKNTSNTAKDFSKKLFTIKIADDQANAIFINNEQIMHVAEIIHSDTDIGAMLNNILKDINAYAPDARARITDNVRSIKQTANSLINIRDLYTQVAALPLPDIKGVNADDLRHYIINEIFGTGMYASASDLLSNFDNSLRDLEYGLSAIINDPTFSFNNYPGLSEQISQVYASFLQTQQQASIEDIRMTIDQNFIQAVRELGADFPEYAEQLATLQAADTSIEIIMSSIRETNIELLNSIISDAGTIFDNMNLKSMRALTDMGYALRTIGQSKDFGLFNIAQDIAPTELDKIGTLGKHINQIYERAQQYQTKFTEKYIKQINEAYEKFYKQLILNTKSETPVTVFKLLKHTDDPLMQFAQMSQYKQLANNDNLLRQEFNKLINNRILQYDLANPAQLFTTEFAMDAMQLSNIAAKKQLREDVINMVVQYKQLGAQSKKLTQNFQTLRQLLSDTHFDMPKRLQLERYIKECEEVNDFLTTFSAYYDTLFDITTADSAIEELRNILINFPELNEKYSNLVDMLEQYWHGELKFEQDPIYKVNRVDTFTPFWENIKKMNTDISETISVYNTRVADGLEDSTQQIAYKPITPWDPARDQQRLNKAINQASKNNAQVAINNVLNFTPEQLQQELAFRHRIIVFSDADLTDNMRRAYKKLSENDQLKGKVHFISRGQERWIILDKKQTVNATGRQYYLNGNLIQRTAHQKQFNEFKTVDNLMSDFQGQALSEILNKLDDKAYLLTGSRLGDSQGDYLTKESLKTLYSNAPEEVQKLLDIEELTDSQFFNAYYFNESVLGSTMGKAEFGVYRGNMLTNLSNCMTQMQSYVQPKVEYVNTVFDSALSISNPNSIYASFSDADLLEALQANTDYKMIALVDNKKYGLRIQEIYPTSIDAIKKGKELGAVIVPLQIYKDMYNVVNHRVGSTGFAKLWSRIMYAYKFGYLARPGAMIRNFIDTNLKTALTTDGEFATYKAQAHKILDVYDDIKNKITNKVISEYDTDGNVKSLMQMYQEYFETVKPTGLTYEQFIELNEQYFSQGVADNVMAQLYKNEDGDLWRTLTEASGKIVEAGNQTERYNRLAVYLYNLDRGADNTSALAQLSKIHFDYSFKSKAEQLVDMVFPFTTFSMRNYSFWIEMLEKHPWIARNYIHLMKPTWNFKDYTPQELARDRQLQTQIINGYIPLAEFNNKKAFFKANPSIQNALQMFSDPINAVYERLAAPIAQTRNIMQGRSPDVSSLIPVLGPTIQSIKTAQRTGSPVPSAVSIQKAKPKKVIKFSNPNLSGTDKFTDSTYRTPKYRKNIVYDSYRTKGITKYRANFYPVIDIAHEIQMRYSVNVYNRIKNRVQTDVYKGIRYRIRLDTNKFR